MGTATTRQRLASMLMNAGIAVGSTNVCPTHQPQTNGRSPWRGMRVLLGAKPIAAAFLAVERSSNGDLPPRKGCQQLHKI